MALSPQQVRHYREQGYVVVPGFFTDSAEQMLAHYMQRRAEGPKPGDTGGTTDHPEDPNHKYPRMINMHDWDEPTTEWATRPDLMDAVSQLLEDQAVLIQTMLYFKPPGARGQALHQDQQYITTDPLLGVWVPLERADRAVGQMVVVPGSHLHGLLEVEAADTAVSFTAAQTLIPEGLAEVGLDMYAGDALFFAGKCIHGSYANTTANRWRRTFICHYVGEHAQKFTPPQGRHVSHVKATP
ncbi:MAG: phytanoyl-CoA dioxygenase family protein [Candidatus Latescibacteria bacterium]|nr:phytanoyl-CoA dioxygenase family protein [Candidatus Latescibacterota bacterium]